MNVLVIGQGGREHALCWKLAQNQKSELVCMPGNPGIIQQAQLLGEDNLPSHSEDLISLIKQSKSDLIVVGPEGPLVFGLVNKLTDEGFACFGPTAEASKLESSKGFTKDLCRHYGIPTADYKRVFSMGEALEYIKNKSFPLVLKKDGLAAGKGVSIAQNKKEAEQYLEVCMAEDASKKNGVVIEDFLTGQEISFFVLCDGQTALPFGFAHDHKRAYDGDQGPNTGGMGAYAPSPLGTPELEKTVMNRIITPTLQAMHERGTPFKGLLYAGLMLTSEGPQLIEYNVRFGDPETQVLLPCLESDLLHLLTNAARGKLAGEKVAWKDICAVTVVMASRGYPEKADVGFPIFGIEEASTCEGVHIFHAGTKLVNGQLVTNGGRVLSVTGVGKTFQEAADKAYTAVGMIHWEGCFYRKDIAKAVLL